MIKHLHEIISFEDNKFQKILFSQKLSRVNPKLMSSHKAASLMKQDKRKYNY